MFLYVGLLNFIASELFLIFAVNWISNHWNNWTKHHFHTSRLHVFSKQPAILLFCFTYCLTCAARFTVKNRRSDLKQFPQGNLKHVLEIIFCISSPEICLFLSAIIATASTLPCVATIPPVTTVTTYGWTVMELSKQANLSTRILQQHPSSYLGNAV